MKLANRLLAVMSAIMLCLIAGNVVLLSEIKTAIINGAAIQEWMGAAVAAIIIITGLFHIFGLIDLIAQFQYFKNDSLVRALAFVIGFLSLFLLAVDVTMLSDIGHEYAAGFDTSGEWRIVFTGHIIHALFSVLLLIQCIASGKALSMKMTKIAAVKDEAMFLTVNQIGMISAVLGFVFVFMLNSSAAVPETYLNGLLFILCIVSLIPYGLAAAYWFFTKRKEKPSGWYDEKQFADMTRGALVTLLVTVFVSLILYFLLSYGIIGVDSRLWFPCYLLSVLLIFSGSTLYFSKKV